MARLRSRGAACRSAGYLCMHRRQPMGATVERCNAHARRAQALGGWPRDGSPAPASPAATAGPLARCATG